MVPADKSVEVTHKSAKMRAHMENIANDCVVCDEAITNPICPDCLAKKMRNWLVEFGPQLASEVDGFSIEGETDTTCLFCGQGMSICAHCYSMDVYEQLAVKNAKLAQEFVSRFDFGLRRDLRNFDY